MAGAPQKVVHQDYIVRQRYNNDLPPPPGDPKLLELPMAGMGKYTMPLYASRMARLQPLNIEADAFLGMPIDLVGMPGVFDGDESSIQAPMVAPTPHEKDRALLRPLKQLGKSKGEVSDISFLRRNQHTAEGSARLDAAARGPFMALNRRRPGADRKKEDPLSILRSTIKGFDIANPESAYKGPDNDRNIRGTQASPAELEAWKKPVHPSKPGLKPVDYYPLLPDLEAIPGNEGFVVFKLQGRPNELKDRPDPRLESGVLYSMEVDPAKMEAHNARVELHKADPDNNAHPGLFPNPWELFLADGDAAAAGMKRMLDERSHDKDNADLYTHASADGGERDSFAHSHVRFYDPGHQFKNDDDYQEVALALFNPDDDEGAGMDRDTAGLQKAAYFYPVVCRTNLQPRRAMPLDRLGLPSVGKNQEPVIDKVNVSVREVGDEESRKRRKLRSKMENLALDDE